MLNVLGHIQPRRGRHNVKDQGEIKEQVAKALNRQIKDGIFVISSNILRLFYK